MRKLFFLLLFTTCANIGFAQTYKIDVSIKGLENSMLVLAEYGGSAKYALDTTYLDSKGKGSFEGNKKLEGGMCFLVSNSTAMFDFLISKGDEKFGIVADTSDYSKVKFIHSPENVAMLEYMQFRTEQQKRYQTLSSAMKTAEANKDSIELKKLRDDMKNFNKPLIEYSEKVAKANKGTTLETLVRALEPIPEPKFDIADDDPERNKKLPMLLYQYNKTHFFDNVNLADDRILRTPFFEKDIFDYYFENVLVFKAPDSIIPCIDMVIKRAEPNKQMFRYVLARVFNKYYHSQVMGQEDIVVHLAENYYLTDKVDWEKPKFTKELVDFVNDNKPTLIGKTSPDLILPTYGKKFESIHGITANYTVLYFYDPDCGHCKKDTPLMKDIYEKYKDSFGLEVYAVNTQFDEKKWIDFIEKYGVQEWINVWDPQRTSNLYHLFNTSTTPQIYLLDKDKKVLGRRLDPENLEKFIKYIMHDNAVKEAAKIEEKNK